MMPKILILSPTFPYPQNMANRIYIWGRIRFFLDCGCRVRLVIGMPRKEIPEAAIQSFLGTGIDCHFLEEDVGLSPTSKPAVTKIQKIINEYKPDVILCEYERFAFIIDRLKLADAELWFCPHNFEVMHQLEKAVIAQPWRQWHLTDVWISAPKWLYGVARQVLNNFRAERIMHIRADRILHISVQDMRVMSNLYPGPEKSQWIVPFFNAPRVPVKRDKSTLDVVYLGSDFINNVNRDGASILIHEIIPQVEKDLPGKFIFHIVGQNSLRYFSRYKSKNIIVRGFIDDLGSFLADIDIACYPLRIGWGMKHKVLEAMAGGLPVVGYPRAFRGMRGKTEAFFSCRTPTDFVAAFSRLLDPEIRETIALQTQAAYARWRSESEQMLIEHLKRVYSTRQDKRQ